MQCRAKLLKSAVIKKDAKGGFERARLFGVKPMTRIWNFGKPCGREKGFDLRPHLRGHIGAIGAG